MSKELLKQKLIEKTQFRKLKTKIKGIIKTHGTNKTSAVKGLAQFMTAYVRRRTNKAIQEIKHERPIGVVAYCKECVRPRMIIEGLCPGCMKNGAIVFDSDIKLTKEMSKPDKKRRTYAKRQVKGKK